MAVTDPEEVRKIHRDNDEEFALWLVVTPVNNKQSTMELCAAPLSREELTTYWKEEKYKLDAGKNPVIAIKVDSKGHSFHKVASTPMMGRQSWDGRSCK